MPSAPRGRDFLGKALLRKVPHGVVVSVRQEAREAVPGCSKGLCVVHEPRAKAPHLLRGRDGAKGDLAEALLREAAVGDAAEHAHGPSPHDRHGGVPAVEDEASDVLFRHVWQLLRVDASQPGEPDRARPAPVVQNVLEREVPAALCGGEVGLAGEVGSQGGLRSRRRGWLLFSLLPFFPFEARLLACRRRRRGAAFAGLAVGRNRCCCCCVCCCCCRSIPSCCCCCFVRGVATVAGFVAAVCLGSPRGSRSAVGRRRSSRSRSACCFCCCFALFSSAIVFFLLGPGRGPGWGFGGSGGSWSRSCSGLFRRRRCRRRCCSGFFLLLLLLGCFGGRNFEMKTTLTSQRRSSLPS